MSLESVRAVADAVLYEGYLLYPYRSTSAKNQLRWQFGVLGPQGAERAGVGEDSHLSLQTLLRTRPDRAFDLTVHVRFLQVQQRRAERLADDGTYTHVGELRVDGGRFVSWDEAIEIERTHHLTVHELTQRRSWSVMAVAGESYEELPGDAGQLVGRLVRQRWSVQASVCAELEPVAGLNRLTVSIDNQVDVTGLENRDDALRRSLVGTHVIIEAREASFVSVIDPPPEARVAAETCHQHRCWPVLAGDPGEVSTVLGSPIILYDYPEIAAESAGELFDATEIDEILTLRVLTMTDEEKAEARATDPKAAAILDRCEAMSPIELQRLHGVLRDPFGAVPDPFDPESDPFGIFVAADPETAETVVAGQSIRKGSIVRINPQRRADAQDLFYRDQLARVTAIHEDFDGETHVAVVLADDPAADLHDWYGRYLYFSPDEIIPLDN